MAPSPTTPEPAADARRGELHAILTAIPNVKAAYLQPPNGLKMQYPCIVYERDDSWVSHADNIKYRTKKRYTVTVIDRNPESTIPDAVEELPFTRFNRAFVSDGTHNTVFQMFF